MRIAIIQTSRAVAYVLLNVIFLPLPSGRADEPSLPRLGESQATQTVNQLSQAFRDSAGRASSGLVTVYSMRGSRMTPLWQRRLAANPGELGENREGASGDMRSRHMTDDQGSGIVVDDKGLILTCNHVVAAADALLVVLPDGRSFEPVEVRGDPVSDLAVIRIEGADNLREVRLGDSNQVQPGDWTVTLANPFELEGSLSAGIVSATDRWVPGRSHPLIQFDAATNPGSSGGALLNLRGEVIGVITGNFGLDERFQGLGMAVPIDVAKNVIARLQQPDGIQKAFLGCQTKILSPAVVRELGLSVAGGLYVENVEEGSPAKLAGLKEGDVITHLGEKAIEDRLSNELAFSSLVPGETTALTLFREGKTIEIAVRVGRISDSKSTAADDSSVSPRTTAEYFDHQLGLGLDRLSRRLAGELGFPQGTEGVLISYVETGGLAYKEGIAAGMVVIRVDDFAISDMESYKQAASKHRDTKPLLMLIQTNDGKHLVVFEGSAR